jgi:hypothetical protein
MRGVVAVNENASRLQEHQRNIERYEKLLKSQLCATELRFVERRLSEERFALTMLQFMSPSKLPAMIEVPDISK